MQLKAYLYGIQPQNQAYEFLLKHIKKCYGIKNQNSCEQHIYSIGHFCPIQNTFTRELIIIKILE